MNESDRKSIIIRALGLILGIFLSLFGAPPDGQPCPAGRIRPVFRTPGGAVISCYQSLSVPVG